MCKSGLASLAFYYFDFRDVKKKDRRGLLSSLIFQLCDQSDTYCDILSGVYLTHRDGSQNPSDGALTQCIKDLLDCPAQAPVYLILDALDECPNSSGTPSPREKVLQLVEDLVLQLPNLRICITSRPEVDIKAVLDPLKSHSLSLHDERGQQQDILDYIRSVVHSDPKTRRWRAEDKGLVIDMLSEKANGMWVTRFHDAEQHTLIFARRFRWVFCQYDFLRRCIPAFIRRAMDELPDTLDGTYDRTLEDIDDRNWEFALRLFQCIVVASRPLKAEELAEFLAFDFKKGQIPKFHKGWRMSDPVEAILSTCSSLITVVKADDSLIVQFSHFSVKEFLTSTHIVMAKERISRFRVNIAPAHIIVTQACLSILLQLPKNIAMDGLADLPLASYATNHWVDHAQFEDVSLSIYANMRLLFDPSEPHFAAWLTAYKYFHAPISPVYPPPRRNPLQYAARLGFRNIVEFLVSECLLDVNSQGISRKSDQDHTLDIDYLDHILMGSVWSVDTWTPSQFAIDGGHYVVLQFLLEHGADVDSRDNENVRPLHLASTLGHLDIVQLLFKHGAGINAQDNDGWTPLHCASHMGRLKVIQALFERGADVNARDNGGCTPLHWASSEGHLEVTQALLECGADTNSRDANDKVPLHRASSNGRLDLVNFLLKHGADVNAPETDGCTPLHCASQGGKLEVTQALLEHGADVDAPGKDGRTPLHYVSVWGLLEVSRALITHGADVNAQDNNKCTPLHLASKGGHLEVFQALLENGAHVDAENSDGWTPLHLASQGGHLYVSQELLENGADVNFRDNDGWTPLHRASAGGHLKVSRALLESGALTNSRDSHDRVPLHQASAIGCLDVVNVLLKNIADVSGVLEDDFVCIPLHLALQDR